MPTNLDAKPSVAEMKPLPPSFLGHRAEFDYATFLLKLPPEYTFDDLFRPDFWRHHEKKLNRLDIVRVVGEGFDVMLTVVGKSLGLKMVLYGGLPPKPASRKAA